MAHRESSEIANLLLVDDDEGARGALGDLLGFEGYRVAYSSNGKEALDYLRSAPLPRVIVLDLQMPVMDGWQFRHEQQKDQKLAAVPVIVITAFHHTGDVDAVAVIYKPINVDRLLTAVRRYC